MDEPSFADSVARLLVAAGHDAIAFPDSMSALHALQNGRRIEVLVTSVDQSAGMPNRVSLALMARMKRPELRVISIGSAEFAHFVGDAGTLLPSPVSVENVVAVAIGMMTPRGY